MLTEDMWRDGLQYGNVSVGWYRICPETPMDLKEGEYALSKDTTVALWKDYMSFYGDFQLQEILGGDFVVVNENLHEEFEKFKHKLFL